MFLMFRVAQKNARQLDTKNYASLAPVHGTNGNIQPQRNMNYQSHIGQDAWVAECLDFKHDGFFLDFGAFDGVTISNTYALEKDLGWRGICVEPNPRYYPQVCAARSCITVNVALWHQSREVLRFVDAHGLSALESFKDGDINADRRAQATKDIIAVDTLNPTELLGRFNVPTLIDFLSLDVEGAEYDVLSALDLKKYAVALMTIEHNHNARCQKQIRDHLARFGYEVVQNRNDDFFYHRGHLARLAGKTVDPLAVFHRIYNTYPIGDGSKKPKLAQPAATPSRPLARIESPTLFNAAQATPDSLQRTGLELCHRHSWHEAAQIFDTLTKIHPDGLEGWRGQILCSRKQGHAVLANLILADALKRHPEWADQLADKDVRELAPT
jgi:FkbM family methyltransferase